MENKSESRKWFEAGEFAAQGLMAGIEAEPNPQTVNAIRKITEGANKVENKIYNDDVERIVNNGHESRKAKTMEKYEKRRKKILYLSITSATIGLVFAFFGVFGWLVNWLAFPLFFGFVMVASFLFGRLFENVKCRGWK